MWKTNFVFGWRERCLWKKNIYIGFILLFIVIVSAIRINNSDYECDYVYKINNVLKNYDFYKAELSENKITLFDEKLDFISDINFKEYDKKIKIKSIRKEENRIFYILSGSVDDEEGYVFINSSENSILDGIKNMKRTGGNSYYYKTYWV